MCKLTLSVLQVLHCPNHQHQQTRYPLENTFKFTCCCRRRRCNGRACPRNCSDMNELLGSSAPGLSYSLPKSSFELITYARLHSVSCPQCASPTSFTSGPMYSTAQYAPQHLGNGLVLLPVNLSAECARPHGAWDPMRGIITTSGSPLAASYPSTLQNMGPSLGDVRVAFTEPSFASAMMKACDFIIEKWKTSTLEKFNDTSHGSRRYGRSGSRRNGRYLDDAYSSASSDEHDDYCSSDSDYRRRRSHRGSSRRHPRRTPSPRPAASIDNQLANVVLARELKESERHEREIKETAFMDKIKELFDGKMRTAVDELKREINTKDAAILRSVRRRSPSPPPRSYRPRRSSRRGFFPHDSGYMSDAEYYANDGYGRYPWSYPPPYGPGSYYPQRVIDLGQYAENEQSLAPYKGRPM